MRFRVEPRAVVATVPPPGVQPDIGLLPDWCQRLEARWTANLVADEMGRLLRGHPGLLVGGLRTNGEIIEDEGTAYELQWMQIAFRLYEPIKIADYRELLVKAAQEFSLYFAQQCDLKKVVTTKLSPLEDIRSSCSAHRSLRVRACVSWQAVVTVVSLDGLFGSQMLGTPESSRRLMQFSDAAEIEVVPGTDAGIGRAIPRRTKPLPPVENSHWGGQPLIARQQ